MKLAAGPPLAIAAVKRAFTGLPTSLAESLETETAMQAPLLGSEDFLEAIAAFAEKRAPTFSGI
jgi:2-(1,2-epoxy-1,2-dihydrophenyl)acetyl-CoA isomerase